MPIYYVDQSVADDTGDGSIGDPWKTIGKVNSVGFSAGDTVRFKRGETWSDATLGSPSVSNFTFEDYSTGAKPFFNGDVIQPIYMSDATISNLTIRNIDISGQDWQDPKETNIRILYVDGVTIDGVIGDGHINAPYGVEQVGKGAIILKYTTGTTEIKNCNLYNWGTDDVLDGTQDILAIAIHTVVSGTVSIHDNIVHDIGADGVYLYKSTVVNSVYNNLFYNFGEQAVDIKGTTNVTVYNNEFYTDAGFDGGGGGSGGGTPMFISGTFVAGFTNDDNIIRNNNFHNSNTGAVKMGGSGSRNKIYDNWMDDVAGAIYLPANMVDTEIYNNIIINPRTLDASGREAGGLYTNNLGGGTKIYNNTFYQITGDCLKPFNIASTEGALIKNNIVYIDKNNAGAWAFFFEGFGTVDPTVQNNLWFNPSHANRASFDGSTYSSSQQALWRSDGHTGGLFSDPLFLNASGGDFNLQSISPAVDVGVDLSGDFTTDYEGETRPASAWDMGALELIYTVDKWGQPISQPQFEKVTVLQFPHLSFVEGNIEEEIITIDKWGQPISQPSTKKDERTLKIPYLSFVEGDAAGERMYRLITHGLKTGSGAGGIKYILRRRGLLSSAIVSFLRRDLMAIEREGRGAAVTPSDTVDLPNSGILYIGGAGSGNLKVDLIQGGTVTFVGIPANTWIDRIRVKRVWATGTDVTSILVFY